MSHPEIQGVVVAILQQYKRVYLASVFLDKFIGALFSETAKSGMEVVIIDTFVQAYITDFAQVPTAVVVIIVIPTSSPPAPKRMRR